MTELSHRIENLEESATLLMAGLVRRLKAEGRQLIDLTLGEPDFDTPEHIRQAAKVAIDNGFTKYPPVAGYPELRKAISDKLKRDNHLDYSPEQILVSTGAKHSIANIVLTLINPGDEVVIPAPYWVSYRAIVQLAEGKVIEIPTTIHNEFKITPEQLENSITTKTKLFIFSSPCNPTGSVYSKAELQALAAIFIKHPQIQVLSDEIYEYINYDSEHHSIASIPDMKNQTIVVNGFSKGFSMTGWRLGYMAAQPQVINACIKMQGQFTSGSCTIAQKAGEAALNSPLVETYKMRDAFKHRRDMAFQILSKMPGVQCKLPQGAFYFFPDFSFYIQNKDLKKYFENSEELGMYLLEDAGVASVAGSAFGMENHIRFSYAVSETLLANAMNNIHDSLMRLHP